MKTLSIIFALYLMGPVLCSGAGFPTEPGSPERTLVMPKADSLMKTVLEHNRTLRVARESYQAAILKAGTGNAPPDPEVEFGYLFGNPQAMGNRVDFKVSQQVDFPTTYIHRSRLRKIRTSQAELKYIISRQEILLRARQLWIEKIHLNQQEQLLIKRLEQARMINDHYREKMDMGEVGQLEFSQSNLHWVALQGEYEQVLLELRGNRLAITEISGGLEVEIKDTVFPFPSSISPDTILKDYMMSPEQQLYSQALELKEEQKNLTVHQNLPKLSAGYYSESVLDQKFKGVQVGITVPLWENANRIKHAKSEVIFAEVDAERFIYDQRRELKQQLDQLESLKIRVALLEEALSSINEPQLLALALEEGEISLSEFYYASGFYFRNQLLLLENQRDLLLKESELMKIYL